MLYPNAEDHIKSILDLKSLSFLHLLETKTWTGELKKHGVKVVHVVSSVRFAKKAEDAGVDAVVAEGFEAGGHNGVEETTTFCLVPEVAKTVQIPLIAAGGIIDGKSMLAAMVLGADGVQMGTRFVASEESSAHINFKQKVVELNEGETHLTLKEITPVRLIKNDFYDEVQKIYESDGTLQELKKNLVGVEQKRECSKVI